MNQDTPLNSDDIAALLKKQDEVTASIKELEDKRRELADRLLAARKATLKAAFIEAIKKADCTSKPQFIAEALKEALIELGISMPDHRSTEKKRPAPKAAPVFHNPANPSETWAGRGTCPKWLSIVIAAYNERGTPIPDDYFVDPRNKPMKYRKPAAI